MDTFFEQIIIRKRSIAELIFESLMLIFGALAIFIMLFIAFRYVLGPISAFFLPLAFGVGFILYYLMNSFYNEYEYSLVNGDFDIDRIIGKRKRKRMISTNCLDFEEFGDYNKNKEKLQSREFNTKFFAANLKDPGLYYAVVRHNKFGLTLIVIEPDDRVKEGMKKFIPRQVQNNALNGDGPNRD